MKFLNNINSAVSMDSIADVTGGVPENTALGTDTSQVIQSPIAKYLWHDLFAFGHKTKPIFETSSNNVDWASGTVDMNLFAQKDSYVKGIIGSTTTGARWTWTNSGFAYSGGVWLVIGFGYTSPSPTRTVLFETSSDGIKWTTRHVSTSNRVSTPFWHYVSSFGRDTRLRLTITKDPASSGNINITTIKLLSARWGDQGSGSEYEYPYSWDGDKNITMSGELTVSQVNGNANTANKLETPRTIAGSSFDGSADVDISYNSLTNKPTIPTSLPANGGNADTLDNKHASDFANASHTHAASQVTAGSLPVGVKATNSTDYTTSRVRNARMSTVDLTAGTSTLSNGEVYYVYE